MKISQITQERIDSLLSSIRNPEDLGNLSNLEIDGFELKLDFPKIRKFLSRGICLEFQKMERGPSERIKDSDIKGAIEAPNPLEYLKSKGYSDKLIGRIFKK